MNLYAETSAVLAWALSESTADVVRESLSTAVTVVASELTLIECDRALLRAVALRIVAEAEASERRAVVARAAAGWAVLRLEEEVLGRCRRAFPIEPVRTLDAMHLASALLVRGAIPDLTLLSLDDRLRRNAEALGFALLPEQTAVPPFPVT